MVVGNGQLAQVFKKINLENDICIFASGVSDSNCASTEEFEREKRLLLETLKNNRNKKFVYFSSCALSAEDYSKNEYYQHKQNMENVVKNESDNYYIFRIPQLFGELKSHTTLINFFYESILKGEEFIVYSNAYRYVIEIEDTRSLVVSYLKYSPSCMVVDLANTYRYKVVDIINVLEKLLNKKANYKVVEKSDGYLLDLSAVGGFVKTHNLNFGFSEDYLLKKLSNILNGEMK